MTRVLVCGGRDFKDWKWLFAALDAFRKDNGVAVVIHGCARGADDWASVWARDRGIPEERYPADWLTHGKGAGPIRNKQMLTKGKPDQVIAFPGGRGTDNMIQQAEKAGVPVYRPAPPIHPSGA